MHGCGPDPAGRAHRLFIAGRAAPRSPVFHWLYGNPVSARHSCHASLSVTFPVFLQLLISFLFNFFAFTSLFVSRSQFPAGLLSQSFSFFCCLKPFFVFFFCHFSISSLAPAEPFFHCDCTTNGLQIKGLMVQTGLRCTFVFGANWQTS